MKGRNREIKKLADRMLSMRGVKNGKLVLRHHRAEIKIEIRFGAESIPRPPPAQPWCAEL